MNYIQAFDTYFLHLAINMRSPLLTQIMIFITNLGTLGAIWITLGILFMFSKKTRAVGIMLIITVVFTGIVNTLILKNIFARPRPFNEYSWVNALVVENEYSFPSGHAFSAFAAAYVLFKYDKKMGVAAYILAVIIAFSRVYLGVHYPTDVIAGAVLGTIGGILSIKLYYIFKRNHA